MINSAKYIFLFSILHLWCFNLFAIQSHIVNITIIVTAENLSASDTIYIAGNHRLLGIWDPGTVNLVSNNDGTWSKMISVAKDTELAFKFTRGSWAKEAVYQDYKIPPNHALLASRDTLVRFHIPSWRDKIPFPETAYIRGKIIHHDSISGFNLKPRNLSVWLPPGYEADYERRYPVLYMHDGQNIFDPLTSAFGLEWQVDETADSLIRAELIEPLIIVGIYNTIDRRHEYTHSDTGRNYMKYIVGVVKPLIDSNYRTLPGREFTATAGSSLGALIAFMLLWEHSGIFSKAACLSVPFKIDYVDYLTYVKQSPPPLQNIQIYIDNGELGIDAELQPGIDQMLRILDQMKLNYSWCRVINADHNETAWSKRVAKFLQLFYARH